MTSSIPVTPVEIAILAIVRAAAATARQIGDFFPEMDSDQLRKLLGGLCRRRLLFRDAAGVFWATGLASEVLSINSVTVWLGDD
jgi:hypothetical protein